MNDILSGEPNATPASPDMGGMSPIVQNAPQNEQAKPSMWKQVLTGALVGLAGGAGQPSFAAGVGGGARAGLQHQQQQHDNQIEDQNQTIKKQESASRIRFQDAQAASMVQDATLKDIQIHNLPQQQQDAHNAAELSLMKTMDALGLAPTMVVDNNTGGKEASAGLEQLTANNGGVPALMTLHIAGKVVAYDLKQLAQAPQTLDTVNKIGSLTGRPAIDEAAWRKMSPQVQNDLTSKAFTFWNPLPTEDNLVLYKNYLNTAKASPASPDKAANVERLQGVVNGMKTGLDDKSNRENTQAARKAGMVTNATESVKARYEKEKDKSTYAEEVAGDVTGWRPQTSATLSEKQLEKARLEYSKSAAYKTAVSAEQSYEMMTGAYKEYKDSGGNLPTGAQSMVALSNHLSTTFGNVKGARVTKDMIEHHLGARSLSDKALVAVQKITNGDTLSPDQWEAFNDLIGQSRGFAWDNATRTAHVLKLPVNSDMLPGDLQKKAPAAKAGGTQTFNVGGVTYNIPADKVAEFKKDHPNAR
jgi:hypothetical protein